MRWGDRLVEAVISLIISGALIRLFQPAVFDYICYAFGQRSAVIKEKIKAMFAVELAERDAMKAMLETHRDVLEFVTESVKRTNEAIPQMVSALDRVAETNERLNDTCEKLSASQQQTAIALGRLEERTAMWERLHALEMERLGGAQGRRLSDRLIPPEGN